MRRRRVGERKRKRERNKVLRGKPIRDVIIEPRLPL
jgi:hypothetical protein